jgi:molybdopterin synthase catalytic subunit
MQVRVLFFGSLREAMGKSAETVSLPEGAKLWHLLEQVSRDKPQVSALVPSLAIAVNEEYATRGTSLKDQDEVALLPPVSGGSPNPLFPKEGKNGPAKQEGKDGARQVLGRHSELVREKIDTAGIVEAMKRGEDGAVVAFEGIVRNNTRGRRTLYLEYDAYDAMAVKQMDARVDEAMGKYEIDQAWIVHRVGRMEIGETSVLIVVTSAHRGAAFEACRFLIDTLKKTAPIWKKEYFEGGAVWADGEAFPEKLVN